MTAEPTSFAERRRKLLESRGVKKEPDFQFPEEDLIKAEDLQPGTGISDAAKRVNAACDSIDIFEVYDRLFGLKRQQPKGKTENVMAFCPEPSHGDSNNMSSWFGTNNGEWVLCCGHTNDGWDKYSLAGMRWGLDSKSDFWEIKKRLALELRGVAYDELPPAPTPEPTKPLSPMPTPVAEPPEPSPWDKRLEERTHHHLLENRARKNAQKIEAEGLFTPPVYVDNLEAELEEPDPEVEWTVAGLHSVGGNTTITAGFKVGKTTFVMNLIRALADGESFLGEHEVRPLDGRIGYLNFEVENVQMKRNFRDMEIKKASNIWHLPLRGHHFDLMEEATYAWALEHIQKQEIEVLILDPFSGAYYGDENDNSQINAFTKRLDEFKRLAGIKDLFIPVHTGRYVEEGNERARGGAKLDDWTDNRWVLARHSETGDRYFKAEGRRVDMEERELRYQRDTNSLTYSQFTGTRKQKMGNVVRERLLVFIQQNPGCGSREIREGVTGNKDQLDAELKKLISNFDVETRSGSRGKVQHFIQGTAPIVNVSSVPQ